MLWTWESNRPTVLWVQKKRPIDIWILLSQKEESDVRTRKKRDQKIVTLFILATKTSIYQSPPDSAKDEQSKQCGGGGLQCNSFSVSEDHQMDHIEA